MFLFGAERLSFFMNFILVIEDLIKRIVFECLFWGDEERFQ
jgi:hypothetical protein